MEKFFKSEGGNSESVIKNPLLVTEKEQDLTKPAIESVRELLENKNKTGENYITPDEIKEASGMEISEFMRLLNGKKVKIDANFEDLFKIIKNGISETEGESKGGVLRKITENKIFRASFVTLMLFLKFGQTQASVAEKEKENKDPNFDKTKIEVSAPTNIEPDNTYHAEMKDFDNSLNARPLEINLERNNQSIKLELGNYFANDLNEIPNESVDKIKFAVENMLSKIDIKNVDEFSENTITVYAHSNELKTNNPMWDGKNENLSNARADKMIEVLTPILKNYKNDRLGEKIKKINNMKIEKEIPNFYGYEKGVLPLTEVINPETNQKYTESEIAKAKNNPKLYGEMLAKARGVELIIKTSTSSEVKPIDSKGINFETTRSIEKIPVDLKIRDLSEFNEVVFSFDNSPSTINDETSVVLKMLAGQKNVDQKITCLVYSDKIESSNNFNNLTDAAKFIGKIEHNGNSSEKSLQCAYDFLKTRPDVPQDKIKYQKQNIYFYWTDENIQGASKDLIEKIKKLEVEKNYKTYGYITSAKNKTLTEYSIEEIEGGLNKTLIETVSPKVELLINQFSTKINFLEKQLEIKKINLSKAKSSELKDNLTNKISEIEKEIENQKNALEKLSSDYESGSVEKLFNNETLKNTFTVGENNSTFDKYLKRTIKLEKMKGSEVDLALL